MNTLVSELIKNGLLPQSLSWVNDDMIRLHIDQIIDSEIKLWFKVKENESMRSMMIKHYDDDIVNGRLVQTKNDPPPHGMYS